MTVHIKKSKGKFIRSNDFITLTEFSNKLKNSKYITSHNLWNIPKKVHNDEVYKDNEMTDEEDEGS